MKDIVFICGATDFHAMDKYWLTARVVYPRKVFLLTDSIELEKQSKILKRDTLVFQLFNIDWLLFKQNSKIGNFWRNFVKAILIPVQVVKLRRFYKNNPQYIYHAIPMYYMVLCYLAKIPFVGTPQGSEILVRPQRSSMYKKFAIKTLSAARYVIVDSLNMHTRVEKLSGVNALILKNGFNTTLALRNATNQNRKKILSIRGIIPIYNIEKIFKARQFVKGQFALTLVYPSCENDYMKHIKRMMHSIDEDFGKLKKKQLYKLLSETLLVISIPASDSSPRSVYESIFAGASVAISYSPFYDELPQCMKDRIILVNTSDKLWLEDAINKAKKIIKTPYIPSEEALEMCDENRTIRKIIEKVY